MSKKIDLTGQRFGRLVVLEEAGKTKRGYITWKCQCDCEKEDNIIIISGDSLRSGNTKSCGCYSKDKAREIHTKHGKERSSVYRTWQHMMQRCYNPNNTSYKNYGGRGIEVCRKWWKFKNFYKDMGDKPKGLTLERKDNDDNYKPSNCKWTTQLEQNRNRRSKKYCWDRKAQKWQAQIMVNYKQIYLGYFNTPEEAKEAYLRAKKKYHKGATSCD